MAVNIAARRGAKNQRRKAVVAQKRKAELQANGIAGQVCLAQSDPIQHCLVSEGLFDTGMGVLILARGATPYSLTMATFLLDTFDLGVKDTFLRSVSGREFASHIDYMSFTSPMVPVDPSYARKLLRDLVTWARNRGIAPHRDYPKLEPIFGATSAASCDVEFQFGYDGKSLFVGDMSEMARVLTESDDGIMIDHGSSDTRLVENASPD
jgi:hypothetical protein